MDVRMRTAARIGVPPHDIDPALGLLCLRGTAMHPHVEIPAKKAPMLPDFGSWQLTQPREFVDRRLRYPEKLGHVHDG